MTHRTIQVSLALAMLGPVMAPGRALALPLFVIDASDGVVTVTASYDSLSQMTDTLTRERLDELFARSPGFDPDISPVTMDVLFRGVAIRIEAAQGSPELVLTVPSIGLRRVFAAQTTREDNADDLLEWFQREGLTGRLAKALVAQSPVDPIAGNPNSAMARTVNASFDRGFGRLALVGPPAEPEAAAGEARENENLAHVGVDYRRTSGDYGTHSYTVPLGYSWRFDGDPRRQISLDLPITYQSVEGAQVYTLGLGLGYSHPLTRSWVLTAGADYAASGSESLGSVGHVVTGTLTSLVTIPVTRGFLVHVGNMVGYSRSLRLEVGDFASDPGVGEVVTKNGVMLYFKTRSLGRNTGIELFALDTRFFGTELYDDGYTELGTSFGISRVRIHGGARYDTVLRIGVSAMFARGNDAFTINSGYMF